MFRKKCQYIILYWKLQCKTEEENAYKHLASRSLCFISELYCTGTVKDKNGGRRFYSFSCCFSRHLFVNMLIVVKLCISNSKIDSALKENSLGLFSTILNHDLHGVLMMYIAIGYKLWPSGLHSVCGLDTPGLYLQPIEKLIL